MEANDPFDGVCTENDTSKRNSYRVAEQLRSSGGAAFGFGERMRFDPTSRFTIPFEIRESSWLMAPGWCLIFSFGLCFLRPHMNYSQMKDERLLAFYENVRQQVALDAGSRYRFAGEGVRAYADKLREEMDRRRLRFTPINWPEDGR